MNRRHSRRWIAVVLAAIFFGSCGYVATLPSQVGTHDFILAGERLTLPLVVEYRPLGGLLEHPDPYRAIGAQFSPDGRSVFVAFGWGDCAALASATITDTGSGLRVDIRVGGSLAFWACPARGSWACTRLDLPRPVDAANPPPVVDALSGESVEAQAYMP